MNRGAVYHLLASELESWRQLSPECLSSRVNKPAITHHAVIESEHVQVEVSANLEGKDGTSVRVLAVAYGPSTWRTQRIEESIVLPVVGNPEASNAGT